MRARHPASVLLSAGLAVALFLSACGRPDSMADRGVRDSVLHRSLGAEVPELDPHLATTLAESQVILALFEGLLIPDPAGGDPLPGVAESWTVSPDGLVYTFNLRAGASWSNGEPLTSTDFVESFQRVLSPELASGGATMLFPIQNARAFHHGEITDFSLVGVEATSDRVLTINLDSPCAYLTQLTTHWSWLPVPIELIKQHGPVFQRGSRWTRQDELISNGPFTLIEWIPNQWIRVERNPLYWDVGTVRLGGGATAVSCLLPKAIAEFQHTHPGILFQVKEAGSRDVERGVLEERIELGIVTLPVSSDKVEVLPLCTDRIVLVAAKDHPLAKKSRIKIQSLQDQDLVGFESPSAIRSLIDGALQEAGVRVHVVMVLRSIPAILRMVGATRCLAFVSQLGVGSDPADVRVLPISGLKIERHLAILRKRDRPLSPAAQKFADLLRHG